MELFFPIFPSEYMKGIKSTAVAWLSIVPVVNFKPMIF